MALLTGSRTTQLDKAVSVGKTGGLGMRGKDPMAVVGKQINVQTSKIVYDKPPLVEMGGKLYKVSQETDYLTYGQAATLKPTGARYAREAGVTVKYPKVSSKGESIISSKVFTLDQGAKTPGISFFKGTGTKTATKPFVDTSLKQMGKAIDSCRNYDNVRFRPNNRSNRNGSFCKS